MIAKLLGHNEIDMTSLYAHLPWESIKASWALSRTASISTFSTGDLPTVRRQLDCQDAMRSGIIRHWRCA